jgi:transcriptional activator SPT8
LTVDAIFNHQGTESGSINLWSVRHEEGKLQHVIRGHKSTVSALQIGVEERTVLTGSWDKKVKLWSLDTGAAVKEYSHHTAQITSLALHHESGLFLSTGYDGTFGVIDVRTPQGVVFKVEVPRNPSNPPPWALSGCWSSDGSRIFVGRKNSSVDEFDFRSKCSLLRNIKMPNGSGSVTAVHALQNNRQLLVYIF